MPLLSAKSTGRLDEPVEEICKELDYGKTTP